MKRDREIEDRRSPVEQRAAKRKNSITARGLPHGRPPSNLLQEPYLRLVGESDASFLYDLLKERTPQQSISHRAMPTWAEHCEFVRNRGYYYRWYVILSLANHPVGTIYVTRDKEIGISILKSEQRKGYAKWALQRLLEDHPAALCVAYANVNPANEASLAFWTHAGFRLLQLTFVKETVPA